MEYWRPCCTSWHRTPTFATRSGWKIWCDERSVFPEAGCLDDGQVYTYKAGNFLMSALPSSLVHSVENDTAKERMVLEGPILHPSWRKSIF